jgi:hypothetical protein
MTCTSSRLDSSQERIPHEARRKQIFTYEDGCGEFLRNVGWLQTDNMDVPENITLVRT